MSSLLLGIFVVCVLILAFLYSSAISTILAIFAILASIIAFMILRCINTNSILEKMANNEKYLLLFLFLFSILWRILYIGTPTTTIDVLNDIFVVNFIIQNGISAYFYNYSTLPHIGSQYPPLYPLLLSFIFPNGVKLWNVKLFAIIVGSLAVIPTYFTGKVLYEEKKATTSALIMATLPYHFLMAIQGINDVLITLFSSMFMYFYILYVKYGKRDKGVLAGCILGISLLFKYTMGVFYLSTLLFALTYNHKKENNILSKTLLVIFVSMLFIIPWVLYISYTGIIEKQISTLLSLSQPGRKSGSLSGYEISVWLHFLARAIFYISPTNILLSVLFITQIIYRRKWDWQNSLLLSWVIVPFLFFGFLHPVLRYFMIAFPALTLIIANSIEELSKKQYRGEIFFTTFFCSLIICFLASYLILFLDIHPKMFV